ncbi:N-acetyltransferase B complex non catalytic subunit-domain-containing protein, partial [Piptocephalis cylindrospora]
MERQLHAIYDLIDNYKSKQAVVQCDRLLKKYPSTPIILALKALATYHTGEKEEARRICDFVASTRPTQAPILQPVSMVYKGIGAHRENSEMYERAMTADRMKDEELPAHLFMSLVREGRYKEQQQLALKMSKAYRKPRYTFWAVVSLILQARESSEQAKPMLYTLAERIMIRAKEDGSLQQHEELRLLVDIYTRIQKSQEGLELLRGDLARRVKFDPEFPVKEVEFLLMAQKWDEARDQALSLLSSNPEEWSYVRLYLSACIHQGMNDTERMDALSRVEKQLILLAQQATSPSSKAAMLLGRLEAISRVVKSNTQETPKECLSTLPDLLFAYIKVWCGKESCFPRVHPYLALLEEGEGRKRFLQELSNHIHFFTQNPSKTAHVLALVNESKLRQVLSPDTCLDECLTRARSHVRRYTQLKSIDESAIIFLYMAGSNMLGMYSEEDHHKIIPRAIRLLETGLIDQPQCYQIKLLLVRAYTLAGNGRAALTLYESLGIKNIQCDTLGHFLVDHLPWLLPPTIIPASHIIRASREIYRQNVRDTPEMIVQAYHHGAYSQIEDFIEFRHRLSRSTQQYVTRIQGWVMDLEECQGLEEVSEWAMEVTGAMEDLEGNDQGREGSLEDNRDYQVFPGILGDDAEERASRPRPRIHEGW